jgi:hypothetical protein
LKEEALDRTQWRTRFGRGYGPLARQTTEWMNDCLKIWSSIPSSLHLNVIKCPAFAFLKSGIPIVATIQFRVFVLILRTTLFRNVFSLL